VTFTVRAGDRDVTIAVVETLDGLRGLESDWRKLLSDSASASGFLTWEWLCTWAETFLKNERRLAVLTFTAGDMLVGIAPFYRHTVKRGPLRLREIGFLGGPDGGSDYLDVIAARGKEQLVAQGLLAVLRGPLARTWDTLHLTDVRGQSAFMAQFFLELRRCGKQYSVAEGAYCPQVALPPSFEAYLAGLSSHGRQAYRRKLRALHAAGQVDHVIHRGPEAVREALPGFRQLYERRWGHDASELFDLITGYLPRSERAWLVELSLLRIEQQAVAGLLQLTSGRTVYQYLMAVDRRFHPSLSVGNLICGLNISAAIDAGFDTYDFLKGEEPYKFQFMNRACRSFNVTVHNRTLRAMAGWTLDASSDFIKILIR
jgi:CelD/BcsL family acetyltransferase involved in cellulose biosynthesis